MEKVVLVTGGAGFIGSALVRMLLAETKHTVINIDKLTYAGSLSSLGDFRENDRHIFYKDDICDHKAMERIFKTHSPDLVFHLAAESHVDRSIDGPLEFIQTNLVGTGVLLEVSRKHYEGLNDSRRSEFRFHHVSTDEVFGDLDSTDAMFTETTSYDPSSPYSASKAGSDHLVRSWFRTFGLPVVVTNCSNNYGPYHFPEKLIPLIILKALNGDSLPVYGDGKQIRDWLYVEDHARALFLVGTKGKNGETYNIGGNNEKTNIDVVRSICGLLEEFLPGHELSLASGGEGFESLITYVADRPGHDRRYAIDAAKIKQDLGWSPEETFESGIRKTVKWYLDHGCWVQAIQERTVLGNRLGKYTLESDQ